MLTVGVDLAAAPAGTAIAVIRWSPGRAEVTSLQVGVDDRTIISAINAADKTGIDCPLGWPTPFVEFVAAHHHGHVHRDGATTGLERRRPLAYRTTDMVTKERIERWPLSVASDRIARAAMRVADLLAELADLGRPVDRSGAGSVVEVYPAASLYVWGLADRRRGRKASHTRLANIVDRLSVLAPWLELGSYELPCRTSDHALDSVVAALTARATALNQTDRPTDAQMAFAQAEGWIAIPTKPLSDLVDDHG